MIGNWKNSKLTGRAVLVIALLLAIPVMILFYGLDRDAKILEEKKETLRGIQLDLQQEWNEKDQELRQKDSPEYLAKVARENGYLLPGEIRFVVTNLDELIENGGDAQTEIAEEGQ